MGTLQLVFKQMRQRALGTWLTLLSVVLGVALAISIMLLREGGQALFAQTDYGYDVLIGPKGSPLQLTLNTVYHIDVSPGNIPYDVYGEMLTKFRPFAKIAVPVAVGDTYQGRWRIVGTSPKLFGVDDEGKPLPPDKVMEYRPDKRFEIAEGRVFAGNKFEAIIGSEVAQKTGLKLGSTFQATHGAPKPGEPQDIHPEVWTVVGVLRPTHTSNDQILFIPLISFYTIAEHGTGLTAQYYIRNHKPVPQFNEDEKHYKTDAQGHIDLQIPKEMWAVSAIMVRSRGGISGQDLMYNVNHGGAGEDLMAVNPASVMREFFETFLKSSAMLLLLISLLVTVVAAVGILVSIYNSVSARTREIAILRALGATRGKVLALICLEAGLIGLLGGILGLVVGHAVGFGGSVYLNRLFGQGFNWIDVGWDQVVYLGVVLVIAVLAGLVPALKAYRTPVATNLVAA